MLRRTLPPEPVSVAADWSRRSASVAALLAIMAVSVARSGAVGGWGGVAVLGAALLFAAGALVLAGAAAVSIWRTGRRGTGRALVGCLLGLLVLAYPAYLGSRTLKLPAISDVSTDLASPPSFSNSAAARAARGNAQHDDPSSQVRDAQRRAYPDVQPVILDLSTDEAYQLVLKTVAARRWKLVEAAPPKGRFGVGHVDAVAASTIMGFPEDVAIRIRPQEGQTRIDIRSASRIERHDVGANAARIESLADDLENAE